MAQGNFDASGALGRKWNQNIDEVSSSRKEDMGAVRVESDGRAFRYSFTTEALAIGELAEFTEVLTPAVSGTTTSASLISTDIVTDTGAFASLAGVEDGDTFLDVTDATSGDQQTYRVLEVIDDDNIRLTEDLVVAIGSAETFIVYRKYKVAQANASVLKGGLAGAPIVAAAADDYVWLQYKGRGMAVQDDSADPVILAEGIIAAGSGLVEGYTAAATTADEAANTIGYSLVNKDGNGDILTPVIWDLPEA